MTSILDLLADTSFAVGDNDPFEAPRVQESQLCLPTGYTLVQTCAGCPEAYDVKDNQGNQWAYLRLRHGSFSVEVPDVHGEQLVVWYPKGDGTFTRDERYYWLNRALKLCKLHYLLEDPDTVDQLDAHDFRNLVAQLLEQSKPQAATLGASVDRVIARLNRNSG